MAGPPRQHLEVEEETRSLTGTGSTRAARRRHLGPAPYFENGCSCAFLRGKCTVVLGILLMGAVYMLGKEKGQSLRFGSLLNDVDRKSPVSGGGGVRTTPVPTYQPTEQGTDPPVPTYDPTKSGTDPPVPTYDPTKSGTLPPTHRTISSPRPSYGENIYIPTPNPYILKFNTTEWQDFNAAQWKERKENSQAIGDKYGSYCANEPEVPMCPELNAEKDIINKAWNVLIQGPTIPCIETGDKATRCGADSPWLNKTIWPLIRGPFCGGIQNSQRNAKFPMPPELLPYHELGYDRVDPTKSTDAAPFDGGTSTQGSSLLWFDGAKVQDHFLKFEAMLEHYYEGLSLPLLESAINPTPASNLYPPMLQAYADQISRSLLRYKRIRDGNANEGENDGMVIGILGDSVTSGTDNCYFDAWPEQFRRQMAPLFGSMGLKIEIRNAAKNGGWNLPSQMLCANDMLGGNVDFLFQFNPFVRGQAIDAEHLIRRALFGPTPTVVSMVAQEGMNVEEFVKKYSSAGFVVTSEPSYSMEELKMPAGYSYWYKDPGRGFWGMQGDGFCRQSTRSGSAPVAKRNWHWGPLVHQTFSDSYGLLFSRATRLAIDDLMAGRMPPDPPKIENYEPLLDESVLNERTQTWKKFLLNDLKSDEVSKGIGGVHCAIGSANQPESTLLPAWLNPAEGTPFEATMKARGGASYVPENHNDVGGTFYAVASVISPPNGAVEKGDWVANPLGFGAEAPRTAEQCMHVDGSTMVRMVKTEGITWLVWKVPENSVSIGRLMICHPRSASMKLAEDSFTTKNVRFHYAVNDANGNWKVVEDTQKDENRGEECTVIVNEMNAADKAAAWTDGVWVAVEWKQEGIFDFDYLVAM